MPMDDELLYRQMPHSLEAEQAVLGSMLIDADCVKDPEQEYLYDADAKRFTLSYLAEADGTTVVYCPFRPEKVQAGSPITWETKMLADQACLVSLKADKVGEMTVTIA